LGIEEKTKIIEEMAGRAQHAAAAFGDVRIPMGRIEFAGHHAIGNRQRAGRSRKQLLDLAADWSETAIEPDLDRSAAFRVNLVDLGEFLATQAEWFLDEDLPFGLERAQHERRVQVMPRADHHRGIAVLLENF